MLFFQNFDFLSCYLGWKGKKWPKMMKNVIWRTDLRNRTSSLSFMVHLCEMIKSPVVFFFFFHFYKSLIFWIFRGKREKMNQTDKKLCLLYLILRDHTSYDLHLWYTCVKWYLQEFFIFLKKFSFTGC